MIFSKPVQYGIRAVTLLAARASRGPVLLDDVVAGTDLPRDFLAKVFQKLVHGTCSQHDLFKLIRHRLDDYLRTMTLADIVACERMHRMNEPRR